MEMLVVIALLTLLIAMLSPSLHQARANARRVRCAAQLDQIGDAFTLYTDAHRGYFPWHEATRSAMVYGGRAGSYPGYRAADGHGPADRAINPYIGVASNTPDDADVFVFRCPDDRGAKAWDPGSVTTYLDVGTSYAYNAWASISRLDTLRTRRTSQAGRPSMTILAGDHTIHNYVGGGDRRQYWHDPRRIMGNILFVDSHVAYHEVLPQDETDDYTWLP